MHVPCVSRTQGEASEAGEEEIVNSYCSERRKSLVNKGTKLLLGRWVIHVIDGGWCVLFVIFFDCSLRSALERRMKNC